MSKFYFVHITKTTLVEGEPHLEPRKGVTNHRLIVNANNIHKVIEVLRERILVLGAPTAIQINVQPLESFLREDDFTWLKT